jgi:hypothetical protein
MHARLQSTRKSGTGQRSRAGRADLRILRISTAHDFYQGRASSLLHDCRYSMIVTRWQHQCGKDEMRNMRAAGAAQQQAAGLSGGP